MMDQRTLGLDLGITAPSVAVALDERGEVLLDGRRVELSLEALEELERAALEGADPGTKLHVVIEKTFPTCEYMSRFFSARGHTVSFAKPDQVKEGRKFLSPKVKTDKRDAWVLARLPQLDPRQLERVHVNPKSLRELKTLVSQRQSLVRQLTFLKNQLIRYAHTLWPGLGQVFGSLDFNPARAFVRELQPKEVAQFGEAELAQFLRAKGRIGSARADRLAAQLVPLAKRAVGLLTLMEDSWWELHRQYTLELLEQVERVEQLIEAKDQELERGYAEADPSAHLKSIPGIGTATAPSILSVFGEAERFASSRQAQGFVGLYPETDGSGCLERKGTALSKRGPAYLRRDLFLAADAFRRQDPQGARLYYEQMAHRGKHHNSALCVVANRLLIPRIVAVMKEKRSYQLRDFQGREISKEEAKELVAQFQVSEQVRRRLRSRKRPASGTDKTHKSRDSHSPPITSEREAPRSGRVPRLEHLTSERLSLTKDQLAMFVFRHVDRLLNSGGNIQEIRSHLRKEAADFFEKRS